MEPVALPQTFFIEFLELYIKRGQRGVNLFLSTLMYIIAFSFFSFFLSFYFYSLISYESESYCLDTENTLLQELPRIMQPIWM